MSKKHISNVNWEKIISNFRAGYQLGAIWEILIVELLANSIDAGARRIWVELEGDFPKILRVVDDGRGMNRKEFNDYHNLGSLTKHKGYGIGWAGIGAKLYIDRCKAIVTETRSKKFSGASRWSFPKSKRAPEWVEISPQGMLGGTHGTAVEIMLTNEKDCRQMSQQSIADSVISNYNYALQPMGQTVVKVNDERIHPFDPRETAKVGKRVSSRLRDGGFIGGHFSLLKNKAPPGFALLSIVVHGKTVGEQYDFKQFARIRDVDRIAGYVECKDLIHITTTSKDNFNRKTSRWRDFDKKVGKAFSDWLEAIGQLKKIEEDRDFSKLAKEIQKDLNRVFRLPEIRNLDLDLFQRLARRLTTIPDPDGTLRGIEVLGEQLVAGTIGGPGEGGGVAVPGDMPGTGIETDPQGSTPTSQRKRRPRSGIQIAYVDASDRAERGWADPGLQAIAVNRANPAFQCADTLREISFYTIDVCFRVVCEVIEDEEDRSGTVGKLFRGYLKVSSSG